MTGCNSVANDGSLWCGQPYSVWEGSKVMGFRCFGIVSKMWGMFLYSTTEVIYCAKCTMCNSKSYIHDDLVPYLSMHGILIYSIRHQDYQDNWMLIFIWVNKDLFIRLLIGWWPWCQQQRCQIWTSLLINMNLKWSIVVTRTHGYSYFVSCDFGYETVQIETVLSRATGTRVWCHVVYFRLTCNYIIIIPQSIHTVHTLWSLTPWCRFILPFYPRICRHTWVLTIIIAIYLFNYMRILFYQLMIKMWFQLI